MNAKRFFYVMVGLIVALGLLILSTVFVGNKLLKQQGAKLSDLRAQNQVVDDQKIALLQAKKDIEKYSELDDIAKKIVPQDKDQARTVREINSIAVDSGIQLQAITFDSSNLGQVAPPTSQPGGSSEASTTPKVTAPTISQVKPVEGIAGVFSMQVIITPIPEQPVSYEQFLRFLEKLENNRRTAHVDSVVITPAENGGVTFTLTLNAYVKP